MAKTGKITKVEIQGSDGKWHEVAGEVFPLSDLFDNKVYWRIAQKDYGRYEASLHMPYIWLKRKVGIVDFLQN